MKIIISEKDTKDRISVEEQELKMYNALKALGIDVDKNLTTNDLVSNFKYYLLKSRDIIKTKQYILKVNNAVTASKVFIELENLGISNASIERVNHSDLENIKNTMRSKAIENARTRAYALIKPLNQILGNAIFIADNEAYNINEPFLKEDKVFTKVRSSTLMQEMANIEFEKIKVGANINVKFILK